MSHRRPVVQVVAYLKKGSGTSAASASAAIAAILEWLRTKQNLKLPAAADSEESFEIDLSEGQPVSVVRFDNLWSLQFDKFDSTVPGRTWRTEASVGFSASAALVGIRLAVIDTSPGLEFFPSVPRIVSDLIRSPGLYDYGVDLSDSATLVESSDELDRLTWLLLYPKRTRPVVVFSDWQDGAARDEAREAARRLAGLAHVYVLSENQSWDLTRELGRDFSVWNGAVRTYYPGFNPSTDEISQHPPATREWITTKFDGTPSFISMLARLFALRSARDASLEDQLPSFRAVEQTFLQRQIAKLSDSSAKKSERELLLEKENELLKQQIVEKTAEFDYAAAEVTQAELERNQYRAQLSATRTQIEVLEERLGQAALKVETPNDFDQLDEWAQRYFAGRMIILPKAARAARKSPFSEPVLVYQCLERLARAYIDARRAGRTTDGLFDDLKVHLERTGDPARLAQWRDEYFVNHRGRRIFLQWHLKRGSDKNEANTLRIYFFYDEEDEQVIVGHLPGHLTNEKT